MFELPLPSTVNKKVKILPRNVSKNKKTSWVSRCFCIWFYLQTCIVKIPKWFKIGYCVSCSCYWCPRVVLLLFVFSILFAVFCVVGELNYGICITCVYFPVNCLPCITYITFWKLYKTWCMPLEMFWNVNVVPVCCIYVFVIFLCCIIL